MNSYRPIRRPTEYAAIRAVCRSPRHIPSVPALMAAHLVVRVAAPEAIHEH